MALIIKMGADTRGLDKDLQKSEGTLDKWSRKIGKFGNTDLGMAAISAGAGKVIKSAIDIGSSFEVSMKKVQGLSNASGEDFLKLEAKAREMGSTTSKSAKDAADAMGYMALAGWDVDQMLTGIKPVLDLSIATQMDLARASDLVTDTMAGLKLEVKDIPRYLDIVTAAQSNSNTSAEQLMEAYLNVGATVSNLGIPLEESSAALGVLANSGLKGAHAGTKMNSILMRMTAQTKVAKVAWNNMGVEVYDSNGKFRGLTTILSEARVSLGKMTKEQQQYALKQAVGTDNVVAFQTMINSTSGSLQELTKELENSDGSLDSLRNTMEDTTQKSINEMKSALEDAAISTFKVLAPIITDVANGIKSMATAFAQLDPGTQKLIVYAAGATALLPIFASLTSAGLKIGSAFVKVGKGVGSLVTGLGSTAKASSTASAAMKTAAGVSNTATAAKSAAVAKATVTDTKAAAASIRHAKSLTTSAKSASKMAKAGTLSNEAAYAMAKSAAAASSKADTMARGLNNAGKAAGGAAGTLGKTAGIAAKSASALNEGATVAAKSSGLFGKLAGTVGSLGTKFLSLGGLINPVTGAIIAGGAAIAVGVKLMNEEVVKSVDLFADGMAPALGGVNGQMIKISEETKKAVGGFLELNNGASTELNKLYVNSTVITDKTSSGIVKKYEEMGTTLKKAVTDRSQKELEILTQSGIDKYGITAEQQTGIAALLEKGHIEEIGGIEKRETRVKEILQTAKDEKRALKLSEITELNEISQAGAEAGVQILTTQEGEQSLILARMGSYSGRMSAEMAAGFVKEMNDQRDKSVTAAQEQYNEQMIVYNALKKDGSESGQKLAQSWKESMEAQRKDTIEKAEAIRTDGINKIEESYHDLKKTVDTDTGQILTAWGKVKQWWKTWNPTPKTMKVRYEGDTGGAQPNSMPPVGMKPIGMPGFKGRAKGGTIFGNGWSIVGENGPEMMHQSQGKTKVIPLNAQDKGASGALGKGGPGGGSQIVIENMNVRNDSDIKKIAEELYRLEDNVNLAQGKVKYFRR